MPLPTSRAGTSTQFWLLHVGGWGGVFLVGYLSLLANSKPDGFGRVWFAVAATGFLGTLGLRVLLRSFADQPPVRVALLLVLPALIVSAAMAATYEVFARLHWCGGCVSFSPLGFGLYTAFQMYVVAGWCSLYLVITTNRQLQRQATALLHATDTAHEAQLKMLRYQLTPHFLFNTLNAVSTLLLDRDTATANRMVHGLSAFLRYTLDADPMQRVTLKQEVDAATLYLDIERIRFSDRMHVTLDVGPDCWPALVPSLLLQPLLENAVKFAVARNTRGATIVLRARRDTDWLHLAVEDDGPGAAAPNADVHQSRTAVTPGVGVGLSNTRERLRALHGDRQEMCVANRAPHGFSVEVRLPFDVAGDGAR
ncbi:MAG TPA: histidine kinase [Luteitalea sp.]|nr:histidine kinase [Luteitalea sp.]